MATEAEIIAGERTLAGDRTFYPSPQSRFYNQAKKVLEAAEAIRSTQTVPTCLNCGKPAVG